MSGDTLADLFRLARFGPTTVRFHPVDVVPATGIGAKSTIRFVPDKRVLPGFLEVWDYRERIRGFQRIEGVEAIATPPDN